MVMTVEEIKEKARLRAAKYYAENKEKCKAVARENYKKNYEKNKEKLRLVSKKWKLENKEKISLSSKKYYLANKEKIAAYKLKYREENKSKIKDYWSNYRNNNKAKGAKWLADSRARKFGATIYMSKEDKAKIAELYVIAKDATKLFGYGWEVDHIVPLAKGGLHKLSNLQVVPKTWNSAKRDRNCDTYWD